MWVGLGLHAFWANFTFTWSFNLTIPWEVHQPMCNQSTSKFCLFCQSDHNYSVPCSCCNWLLRITFVVQYIATYPLAGSSLVSVLHGTWSLIALRCELIQCTWLAPHGQSPQGFLSHLCIAHWNDCTPWDLGIGMTSITWVIAMCNMWPRL